MDRTELYRDIAKRTQGDVYIGVVGPVRTGKSTFIKRFLDLLVLPNIENEHVKARVIDELPQSGAGRSIMTTQPRFVPNEAVRIEFADRQFCNVRLVDCVGYLVPGAIGHLENDAPRMVRTPWFDYDIPFEEAAELGTRKVIAEHSTIGVVMTTDGSITELPRESYVEAEARVLREMKETGKPFVLIINSIDPEGEAAQSLRDALSEQYGVCAICLNAMQMTAAQAAQLIEEMLLEFPLRMIEIRIPSFCARCRRTTGSCSACCCRSTRRCRSSTGCAITAVSWNSCSMWSSSCRRAWRAWRLARARPRSRCNRRRACSTKSWARSAAATFGTISSSSPP